MVAKKHEAVMELPVSFGNVNVGDKTARLGISIDREHMKNLKDADRSLCGRRLTGSITVAPAGDQEGQGTLPGMEDLGKIKLDGIFDCKSLNVSPKAIGTGLTFNLKGLDISTLTHFAKRQGLLTVLTVEDLPEDEPSDDDDEGDQPRKTPAPPRPREEWESTPIREALTGLGKKVYEGMEKAGLDTIGKLFEWKNDPAYSQGRWWTSIDGVGNAACDKIDDAIEAFTAALNKKKAKAAAKNVGKE